MTKRVVSMESDTFSLYLLCSSRKLTYLKVVTHFHSIICMENTSSFQVNSHFQDNIVGLNLSLFLVKFHIVASLESP